VKKVYTNPHTVSGARGLPLISERDGTTAVTLNEAKGLPNCGLEDSEAAASEWHYRRTPCPYHTDL